MGIYIQNGLIKEIWENITEYDYPLQDKINLILQELYRQFPDFSFRITTTKWMNNGNISPTDYWIMATRNSILLSAHDLESIENIYYKILVKLSKYKKKPILNIEKEEEEIKEDKYKGGLF